MNQANDSCTLSMPIDRRKLSLLASLALTMASAALAMAIWKACLPHHDYKNSSFFLCLGIFLSFSWILIGSKERATFATHLFGGVPDIFIEDKSHYFSAMSRFTTEVLNEERRELLRRAGFIEIEQQKKNQNGHRPFFIQGLGFIALGALLMLGAMAFLMGGAVMDLSMHAIIESANSKEALASLEDGRAGLDMMQIGLYVSGMIGSGLGIATGLAGFWRNRKIGTDPMDDPVETIQDRIDLIDAILTQRALNQRS